MNSQIKSLIIIHLCFILMSSCNSKYSHSKKVILSEISNPHEILTDDEHLIISDGIEGTTLYLYSKDDLSLYSSFGGSGEGQGEFMVSGGHEVSIDCQEEPLLISSHWKTTEMTKEGEFIRESAISKDTYAYQRFGDYYTGQSDTTVNDLMYYTFNLYNEQFKFVKEISRIAGSNQGDAGLQVLVRKYQGLNYKDHYYLKGKSDDFEIEVFDKSGSKVKDISLDYQRIPITDVHKNDVFRMYLEHPLFGQFFDSFKSRIVFPEALPAIYQLRISDESIYAVCYPKEDALTEVYQLDLTGKLIKIHQLPIQWLSSHDSYPFTISQNKLYQLLKNELEAWELHITKM